MANDEISLSFTEKKARDNKLILAKGFKVPISGVLECTIESIKCLGGATKNGDWYASLEATSRRNTYRFLIKEKKATQLITAYTGAHKGESESLADFATRCESKLSGKAVKITYEETIEGVTGYIQDGSPEQVLHTYTGKRFVDSSTLSYDTYHANIVDEIADVNPAKAKVMADYYKSIDIARMQMSTQE
jgi:hypothetical protein